LKEFISSTNANKATVFIGKKERDGITPEMSKQIWDIYKKYIQIPVEVEITPITPVRSAYDFIESHPDANVVVGAGEKDMGPQGRYAALSNKEKYPNAEAVAIPAQEGGISGSQTRAKIAEKDPLVVDYFTPSELSKEDKDSVKNILGI
jgi:hypothetical protein